jgi:hypothetical protein
MLLVFGLYANLTIQQEAKLLASISLPDKDFPFLILLEMELYFFYNSRQIILA